MGYVTSISQQKKRLRTKVLRARDAMSQEEREAKSAMIFTRLRDLHVYKEADSVALFVTYRSEMNTYLILDEILERGKSVAVPRVTGRGEMEFFRITDHKKDLEVGAFGIREPRPGSELTRPQDIDLLLTPGAVFDPFGYRIGYGGGFYDRYIKRLRPDCPVIALGFELQIVDRVPTEQFDTPVDMIVTEDRVIRAG